MTAAAPSPLLGVRLFEELPQAALARLERFPALEVGSGRGVVFRAGDPPDAVYAILGGNGRIRLGVPDANSKRLMVELLGPGEVFGEIGVIAAAPRTADAIAEGAVRLLRIPAAAFLAELSETPRLGVNLARLLAARLRRTFTLLQDATFETVEVRLARQVLYLAQRHGRSTERGIRVPGQLRQADIADLLGTTTRSIISVLNAWRSRGWVTYDGDKALLVVLDAAALQGLLGDTATSDF